MFTSRISASFILFLFWEIALPICTAKPAKPNDDSRTKPGLGCHHHLKYVDGKSLTNELKTLPDFVDTSAKQNERSTATIRSVLALYALSVDGKDFQSLEHVFMPDVMVNMSMVRPIIQSLTSLQNTLRDDFDGLLTHHQLGIPDVRIIEKNCQALTITYFTATIMGTGESSEKGPPTGDVSILHN
ncbi:hypothetical protein MMC22_007813 [Lobaria immixta]|nr:hypothetical protein [Lobaria immixta]